MSNFEYTARNARGQEVSGVMQAETESAVIASLSERQLFPVRVWQQATARAESGRRRVRSRDLGVMYGQLADLLNSGVPMLRALETLGNAARNETLGRALLEVRTAIAEGESFADALAAHPRVFPPLHAAMARAGEQGGFLESVLANLAEFLDRQDELASKVTGSLIYPIVLTVVGIVAVGVILLGIVPKFRPMFEGMPLPAPTQLLFAVSGGLTVHWPMLILGALVVAGAAIAAARSPGGKRLFASLKRRIPVFGGALKMVALSRFCRTFGTLLHNGVPMLQSLAISKEAIGDPLLTEHVEQAAESVKQGDTLSEPLARSDVFPPEIMEMIAVAEQSNQLEKVLLQIAETVERRTSRKVDQAVRLIEPLVLLMIAIVIAFVAYGLLYPIFTMAQRIGQ